MKSKLKAIFCISCFLICVSSLFAVDVYVSDIYKKIDQAFYNHSAKELDSILSNNVNDRNYYLMEHYAEKKIRQTIIKEDYKFAMDAIEIVIDNNLDNDNAVEMYNVVYESYELQKQSDKLNLQRQNEEKERIAKAKEEKREAVEKQFVAAESAEGGSVYVSQKVSKSSSSKWEGSLGIVDLMLLMEPERKINSFHYGISLDFSYLYMMNHINVGGEAVAAFNFMGICDDNKKLVPLVGDVKILPKISFPPLSSLFFKAGFGIILTGKASTAILTDKVNDSLLTPIIGFEWDKIPLGPIYLGLGAEWYAAHLYTENLNLAMGVEANIEIPFANFEKVSLDFNIGIKDKFFLKDSGIENRGSLTLAIGVENVIK